MTAVPDGHRLLVDGAPQSVPARVKANQELRAEPVDPTLVATRQAAAQAVGQAMQQNRRAPVYLDTTVREPRPRAAPPPADYTVSKSPVHVRLGGKLQDTPAQPLPSPQKANQPDGEPIPDGVLGDGDVLDLAVDLGGGPTEADVEHAAKQQ